MAVCLTSINQKTRYCEFSFDDWEKDGDKLPTMNSRGKDSLSTILKCSQGSIAIGTDGTSKILRGKDNQWIEY